MRRWCGAHGLVLACVFVLACLAATLVGTLARKSLTIDEYLHIPAGVAYTRGDFRPNAEHPPLAKLLAALPLLGLGVSPPTVAPAETPTKQTYDTARYFWQDNAARFVAISFWARLPPILLTVALGALIVVFARAHFGDRAAFFAALLFALEPTILAHGRVVHTDIPAALGLFGVVVVGVWYAQGPSVRRAGLVGLALGLMLVTKFSLLTLLPPLLLVAVGYAWREVRRGGGGRRLAGHAALVGGVALLTLNACYGFRRQPLDAAERAWVARESGASAAAILDGIDRLGWLLPPRYLFGFYQQYLHNREGHAAALLGDYSLHGWWYYFPVAYALKTPLPLLLLALGALGWGLWRGVAGREWRFLWLLGPLACFLAIACLGGINIGIRHLLPLYPFLLILAGAALDRLWGGLRWPLVGRLLVAGIVGWLAVETALAFPDFMPYQNQIGRAAPPWALLSDSNVEWGDDLGALAEYLRARGETAVAGAALGGRDQLPLHGIDFRESIDGGDHPPAATTTYIAIGASYLNGSTVPLADGQFRPDYFAAYRGRTPEAVLGGTVFVFRNEPLPLALTAPLPDGGFRAEIVADRVPATLRPGERALIRVRLRNEGSAPWPPAPAGRVLQQLRLGNYWLDGGQRRVAEDARSPLPYTLAPGEALTLHLLITAPAAPGDYVLVVDLVQEGVAWFGDRGSTPAKLSVRVVP